MDSQGSVEGAPPPPPPPPPHTHTHRHAAACSIHQLLTLFCCRPRGGFGDWGGGGGTGARSHLRKECGRRKLGLAIAEDGKRLRHWNCSSRKGDLSMTSVHIHKQRVAEPYSAQHHKPGHKRTLGKTLAKPEPGGRENPLPEPSPSRPNNPTSTRTVPYQRAILRYS